MEDDILEVDSPMEVRWLTETSLARFSLILRSFNPTARRRHRRRGRGGASPPLLRWHLWPTGSSSQEGADREQGRTARIPRELTLPRREHRTDGRAAGPHHQEAGRLRAHKRVSAVPQLLTARSPLAERPPFLRPGSYDVGFVQWNHKLQCWLALKYPMLRATRARLARLYYELAGELSLILRHRSPSLTLLSSFSQCCLAWTSDWSRSRRTCA